VSEEGRGALCTLFVAVAVAAAAVAVAVADGRPARTTPTTVVAWSFRPMLAPYCLLPEQQPPLRTLGEEKAETSAVPVSEKTLDSRRLAYLSDIATTLDLTLQLKTVFLHIWRNYGSEEMP